MYKIEKNCDIQLKMQTTRLSGIYLFILIKFHRQLRLTDLLVMGLCYART